MSNFKLPIQYNHKITDLTPNTISDINLDGSDSVYQKLFNPTTLMGTKLLEHWKKSFSYDKKFLKQSQSLYQSLKVLPYKQLDDATTEWSDFKNQNNFIETYNYLDLQQLNTLNQNSLFLQLSCINTILSPIMTIILPIIVCIIPYIVLKIRNPNMTITHYYEVLKNILARHPLGKLFEFSSATMNQKGYIIVSLLLYIFQIYQNIKNTHQFYKNTLSIQNL